MEVKDAYRSLMTVLLLMINSVVLVLAVSFMFQLNGDLQRVLLMIAIGIISVIEVIRIKKFVKLYKSMTGH